MLLEWIAKKNLPNSVVRVRKYVASVLLLILACRPVIIFWLDAASCNSPYAKRPYQLLASTPQLTQATSKINRSQRYNFKFFCLKLKISYSKSCGLLVCDNLSWACPFRSNGWILVQCARKLYSISLRFIACMSLKMLVFSGSFSPLSIPRFNIAGVWTKVVQLLASLFNSSIKAVYLYALHVVVLLQALFKNFWSKLSKLDFVQF